MKPKEKAEELVRKFKPFVQFKMGVDQAYVLKMAKLCALVAVDEIISSREDDSAFDDTVWINASEYYKPHPMYKNYWNLVKQEIEKL